MTADKPHHPLPASEEARHDLFPESVEASRPRGDDDPAAANRGRRAGTGSGAATGSGAGAGGGGAEDFDDDAAAGEGISPQRASADRADTGGDAPSGGSR